MEEKEVIEYGEKSNNIFRYVIISILTLFLGAGGMYAIIYFYPSSLSTVVTKVVKDVTVNETGISDAVEKAYDAVVTVNTYKDEKGISSGTGFVYKIDGKIAYILTNNHVIDNGDKVYATFTNGKKLETTVVGSDIYSDIAVLSVKASDIISVMEIGSSKTMRVGDTVFTVGAPLDSIAYSWTVTRGILSGKDRLVEVSLSSTNISDYVMSVIQTDAAINSGNSGGPLCNSNGEVIGINSLKLISSGVEGMGFAIPIEDAVDFAEKIIEGKAITKPFLGISMVNVSDAMYYRQYYSAINESGMTTGVYVATVDKNSAAAKGGLEAGDIITKIEGKEVTNVAYLRYLLYKHEVGDTIKITYKRDGKEKSATVTLKAQNEA